MKSYFYIFISSLNKTSNNIKIKVIWILAHFDPTFFQNQVKTNYRRDSKIQKALEIQIQCFSIILIHFSGPKISSTFCASQLKAGWPHYLNLHGGAWWLAPDIVMEKRWRTSLSWELALSENSKFWWIQLDVNHRITEYQSYRQLFMLSCQLGGRVSSFNAYQCTR